MSSPSGFLSPLEPKNVSSSSGFQSGPPKEEVSNNERESFRSYYDEASSAHNDKNQSKREAVQSDAKGTETNSSGTIDRGVSGEAGLSEDASDEALLAEDSLSKELLAEPNQLLHLGASAQIGSTAESLGNGVGLSDSLALTNNSQAQALLLGSVNLANLPGQSAQSVITEYAASATNGALTTLSQTVSAINSDTLFKTGNLSSDLLSGQFSQLFKNSLNVDGSAINTKLLAGLTITPIAEAPLNSSSLEVGATNALVSSLSQLNAVADVRLNTANISQLATYSAVGTASWGNEVAEKVMWMASQGLSEAEIQLDPPELGPLQARVVVNQDQAQVVFNSHSAQVREALDQQAARLREMFAGEGLNLVDVDVSDQSFNGQQETQGDSAHKTTTDINELLEVDEQEIGNQPISVSQFLVDQFV